MYKVTKPKGYNERVTVENTDTKGSIIIGRVSMEMLSILESAGYKTEDDSIKLTDEWDLEVNKETADKLTKLAMPMKKPTRKFKDKAKQDNKNIDAMDVLLGLAQYK